MKVGDIVCPIESGPRCPYLWVVEVVEDHIRLQWGNSNRTIFVPADKWQIIPLPDQQPLFLTRGFWTCHCVACTPVLVQLALEAESTL